ncbi:hypothetical protein HDU84_008570 [Entophlyctis sp. JEL0112]|nr:hypothetical protein HDU84_008570 [Entophlyctis sp. JEL0112]
MDAAVSTTALDSAQGPPVFTPTKRPNSAKQTQPAKDQPKQRAKQHMRKSTGAADSPRQSSDSIADQSSAALGAPLSTRKDKDKDREKPKPRNSSTKTTPTATPATTPAPAPGKLVKHRKPAGGDSTEKAGLRRPRRSSEPLSTTVDTYTSVAPIAITQAATAQPKQLQLQQSLSGSYSEKHYAGATFQNAPAPSALPIPVFDTTPRSAGIAPPSITAPTPSSLPSHHVMPVNIDSPVGFVTRQYAQPSSPSLSLQNTHAIYNNRTYPLGAFHLNPNSVVSPPTLQLNMDDETMFSIDNVKDDDVASIGRGQIPRSSLGLSHLNRFDHISGMAPSPAGSSVVGNYPILYPQHSSFPNHSPIHSPTGEHSQVSKVEFRQVNSANGGLSYGGSRTGISRTSLIPPSVTAALTSPTIAESLSSARGGQNNIALMDDSSTHLGEMSQNLKSLLKINT